MAKFARRLVAGLAIVGVAYALNPKREGQINRWRERLGSELDRLPERYGPTLRKVALAAGFMPGLKFRWRVLAAALPQIADRLQSATGRRSMR